MKSYFPFTDYDFWAYISSGFVFLFVLDHVMQTGIFDHTSWTIVEGLIAIAAAYAVGHLLAGGASAVLERRVVAKWFGRPSVTLLGAQRGPAWFRRLYPTFYDALPSKTVAAILAKGQAYGITEPGEALFWLAFDASRTNKAASRRMDTFLNLYGLCRNLSFTAFVVTPLLLLSAVLQKQTADYWWSAASVVLGVGMGFRYLKFYRHYSVEVFTQRIRKKDSGE
jgi:hypothetical protein